MNQLHLITEEDLQIFDHLESSEKHRSGPVKTLVQIYMNEDSLANRIPDFQGSNTVVATGREFIAQRICNLNKLPNGSSHQKQFYNYSITHFGIGSGGADVYGKEVTLLGPKITDRHLYEPISLGNELYLNEPSGINPDSFALYTSHNSVKPIYDENSAQTGDIYLSPVVFNDANMYYTKVKFVGVIPSGEPTALEPLSAVQISEAALYITNENGEEPLMFAHICFPPKWLEKESKFTLFWYISC